uniref:Uncharacterized protein n=1 Tax=Arundo donax TaxID=35708 RepID=A0A0A8ZND0_ARUDO
MDKECRSPPRSPGKECRRLPLSELLPQGKPPLLLRSHAWTSTRHGLRQRRRLPSRKHRRGRRGGGHGRRGRRRGGEEEAGDVTERRPPPRRLAPARSLHHALLPDGDATARGRRRHVLLVAAAGRAQAEDGHLGRDPTGQGARLDVRGESGNLGG